MYEGGRGGGPGTNKYKVDSWLRTLFPSSGGSAVFATERSRLVFQARSQVARRTEDLILPRLLREVSGPA